MSTEKFKGSMGRRLTDEEQQGIEILEAMVHGGITDYEIGKTDKEKEKEIEKVLSMTHAQYTQYICDLVMYRVGHGRGRYDDIQKYIGKRGF